MKIFIPTRGRVGKQITWHNLPKSIKKHTRLVCLPQEAKLHGDIPVMVLPPGTMGISGSRQYIIDACREPLVMLDDDLEFYYAGPPRPGVSTERSLYAPTDRQVERMFEDIFKTINEGFAHVSVAPREGWNRYPKLGVSNCRYMRVLGYDPTVLHSLRIRFDAVNLMEDFHVNLSLLKAGQASVVLTDYAQGQKGSGTKGGCSLIRTPDRQAKAAHRLAKLHAPFVKVVEKPSKWGGAGTRTDVTVYWKKAYESSKNAY